MFPLNYETQTISCIIQIYEPKKIKKIKENHDRYGKLKGETYWDKGFILLLFGSAKKERAILLCEWGGGG